MPRRAEVSVRPIAPDAVYNSPLVTQVINKVMSRGKKSTAEQIVYDALTRNVGADLGAVGQPDAGNLAKSRVRLPRGLRHHARADAPLLRRAGERRGLHLGLGGDAALADELVDGGQ